MNILALVGSPRKNGNSAVLVKEMLKDFDQAQVSTIQLNDMNIRGCQACMYCRTHPGCMQQDDMQRVYPEIEKADLVIFAFPVYMWQMTAQMKLCVDRMFAYYKEAFNSPFYKGKKAIMAVCCGAEEEAFAPYIEQTRKMIEFIGFESCQSIVFGEAGAPGDVANQKDKLEEARKMVES